ncbi:MAG TPA: transporter [Verrucomicrobiales bacterium]|nr:transporter [Verrucomicrobiales bacterium]
MHPVQRGHLRASWRGRFMPLLALQPALLMRSLCYFVIITALPSLPAAETKPAASSILELVSRTLEANPEIRFYEAEIASAKATRSTAGRLSNPELSLEIGQNRVSSADSRSNGLAFSAALAQPIEWPGRLGLRKAIANRDITLAELGLERFRFHLASRVRVLAYTLAAQQEISAAASEVASRYAALREVMVQREPAGIAPQLEIVTIEAAALVAESRAATAAVAVQKILLELNQLMGRRADTSLVVKRSGFDMKTPPSLDSLLGTAMQNHYDLRIRRTELEQQGFKVELAKNERYPSFTVGPYVEVQNTKSQEDQTVGGLGISFPLPFWKSGKAEVASAEARLSQAQATLNAAQREVERLVTESMLLFKTQQSRVLLWKGDAITRFSEAATLADRHYRLGAVPTATFVELQDKYLEAVESISEAQSQALEAGLMLEELTGAIGSLITLSAPKP